MKTKLRFREIYILSPASLCTGGPEALHQLCYYLNGVGVRAKMVYYVDKFKDRSFTPEKYKKYYNGEQIALKEIEDSEDCLLIVPESIAMALDGFQNMKKIVLWLGILHYCYNKNRYPIIRKLFRQTCRFIKNTLLLKFYNYKYIAGKKAERELLSDENLLLHLTGSKYAYEYLQSKNIQNVKYLVEPISKGFLDSGKYLDTKNRKDIVLYNPSKPSKIMDKLLKNNEFNFVPLKGYDEKGLIDIYRQAKLYVDFGEFGGPERIPKETVYNGCALLVRNHNAAMNDFDVAIPQKYKLDDVSIENITGKIRYMLENYEEIIGDFAFFADKIDNLEKNFIASLTAMFETNT